MSTTLHDARTANLLGALALALTGRIAARVRRHPNANDSAAAALNLISFYDGWSNNELARALQLSHPATVRLVDRLVADGLVQRRSGSDKRAVAFTLTRRGAERGAKIIGARSAALQNVTEILSAGEKRQLDRILEKLLTAMTETADDGNTICRLCDEGACPPDRCPVHQAALRHEAA